MLLLITYIVFGGVIMKFGKFLMFTLLCSVFILSACGKDETVNANKNESSTDDVPASERYADNYIEPELSDDEKFMDEFDVKLTGKDVQYNLANNLDKDFFLKGTVEICDYYNYGFTNEKKFFCGKMTTDDNQSWYLYFNRSTFESVYDYLMDGNLSVMVSANVPTSAYKSNQGNMAAVKASQMYNSYEDN